MIQRYSLLATGLLLLGALEWAAAAPAGVGLAGLEVLDGRAGKTVPFAGLPARLAAGRPFDLRSADGRLALSVAPRAGAGRADYPVTLTNAGKEQAWLLVRAVARFRPAGDWHYFNGNYSTLSPREPRRRASIAYTLPMCAAYDGTAGVGLGFDPMQLFSYIETEVRPAGGGMGERANGGVASDATGVRDEAGIAYGVKIVLDPGQSETIRFVTFPFAPRWGEVSAVTAYHALFPAAFRPDPEADPRIFRLGTAGDGPGAYKPTPEGIRRLRLGIDWCYAPVKIPGDWFGRPETWDRYNENVEPKPLAEKYGTLDHWHGHLRTMFTRVEDDFRVAPYFYIINWAYHRLAQERFPEALVTDPAAQNSIPRWVCNNGPDVRLFPLGNRAEDALRQDLADIWRAYPLAGFGHDVAMGDVKYRGPSLAKAPGRAWDAEGIYCDVSVAIAHTADLVRALPRKRFRAGFWTNGGHHVYSIAVRSDASAFEGSRHALSGWGGARYARYVLGTKAFQMFSGDNRDHSTDFYDWQSASADEIRRMYLRMGRATLGACFRWGYPPTTDTGTGYEELMELVYTLADELMPLGWQMVPGARVTPGVDLARYGSGANTHLVLINPTGTAAAAQVAVSSGECGGSALVFGKRDGTPVENRVEGGTTSFAAALAPGEIAVYPAVADLRPAVRARFRGVVRAEDAGGWRHGLSGTPAAAATAHFPAPAGCRLQEGKAAAGLSAGRPAEAQAWFVNRLFGPREADLRRFRFFEGEQALTTIVVPDPPSPEVRRAAVALREYFRFYTQEVLARPKPVLLPVARGSRPAGSVVLFEVGKGEPAVRLVPGSAPELRITAPEDALVETTRALLRVLDREYPFYGIIPPYVHQRPNEAQARKKAGIALGMLLKSGEVKHPTINAWSYSPASRAVRDLE